MQLLRGNADAMTSTPIDASDNGDGVDESGDDNAGDDDIGSNTAEDDLDPKFWN